MNEHRHLFNVSVKVQKVMRLRQPVHYYAWLFFKPRWFFDLVPKLQEKYPTDLIFFVRLSFF